MTFQQLINKISRNPERLFLRDGFGAILSAFLLGVVLVRLESIFGIHVPTLYFTGVGVEKSITSRDMEGLILLIIRPVAFYSPYPEKIM